MFRVHGDWLTSPVLVGRSEELDQLRSALAAARAGNGDLVLIAGQPGVGKSRILIELRASCDCLVVEGRCYEEDTAFPLAPLAGVLRSILSLAEDVGATALVQARAADLAYLTRELPRPGQGTLPAPGIDPQANQRRLFEALTGLLFDLAARQPLLLALEDLHWSDQSTLEFLGFLARQLAGQRVLVVGTYGPDEAPSSLLKLLDQLRRRHLAQEIVLRPLALGDVDALLRCIFDTPQPIRPEFLHTVFAFSEGNPYYVEELLRTLLQAGDIYRADGVWERKGVTELRVPRGVQDAVQRRATQVSAPARDVLTLAAVVGKQFGYALLQQLTGMDEAPLLGALKELIAAQLIVEASAETLAFRHSLTREAVHSMLLRRERRALHRRVAETLERLYVGQTDVHAPELAYHFYEGEVWAQAMRYAVQAGEQAQALDATHEALTQFNRALACAEHLGIQPSVDLLLRSAQLNETVGDFDAANSLLAAALQHAQEAADVRSQWQAMLQLGFLWTARDYETSQA